VILLIRHAWAGDRSEWEGEDRRRPLDKRGRRQADELVSLLAPYEVDRILSSPYDRCVQTVDPLAGARGLEVELREELSEELQAIDGARLVRSLDGNAAVSCHGGLSEAVCDEHQNKGAVLVLEASSGSLRPVARFRARG
jgi:phosphohistidine phosphatase SixA